MKRFRAAFGRRGLRSLLGAGAMGVVLLASSGTQDAVAVGESRSLTMVHSHTGESITITYKRGGSFDSSALEKLNWFLRDWRIDEPISMAPQLFDIVWHVYREVGATEPIRIMSAYRSPGTNAMLRRRSRAVAKESQHMRGNAMDIHIPGVSMARAREIGLRLHRGGVGYYPSANSPFVHLDVGSVRHWPKMSRDQLERIFPDGKTVHIPADGKPLANYEAALAEVQANGGTALDYATVTSGKSLWALLFGSGEDEEEALSAPARGRGRGAATRVADARGRASAGASSVSAFSNVSDNPMNPGIVRPIEAPAARPVAVATLAPPRAEPPPVAPPRTGGLQDLDTKGAGSPPPVVTGGRFAAVSGMPLPPMRPQGAAFAAMVASASPLPLPPVRPAGLGSAGGGYALASASSVPAPAPAPVVAAAPIPVPATAPAAAPAPVATKAPLPPARPDTLRAMLAHANMPDVLRGEEGKPLGVPAAQAYAAVSAPLPPQRQRASVAPVAVAPAAVPMKVRPPAPVLDAGRANARGAGEKPLSVPKAVAVAPAENKGGLMAQGFATQKYMPSFGFSGSFLREVEASGGFRRLGQ